MEHELKTDSPVFEALIKGEKTHQLRKDDRHFQIGDTLRLRETRYTGAEMAAGSPLEFTGREDLRLVTHILRGYGLEEGWVVLSCHEKPKIVTAKQESQDIANVLTSIITRSTEDLLALDEAGLKARWRFVWNTDASTEWNLYKFSDALESYRRQCRQWEEYHNGHTCVVERVRDKYLLPELRRVAAILHANITSKEPY